MSHSFASDSLATSEYADGPRPMSSVSASLASATPKSLRDGQGRERSRGSPLVLAPASAGSRLPRLRGIEKDPEVAHR